MVTGKKSTIATEGKNINRLTFGGEMEGLTVRTTKRKTTKTRAKVGTFHCLFTIIFVLIWFCKIIIMKNNS